MLTCCSGSKTQACSLPQPAATAEPMPPGWGTRDMPAEGTAFMVGRQRWGEDRSTTALLSRRKPAGPLEAAFGPPKSSSAAHTPPSCAAHVSQQASRGKDLSPTPSAERCCRTHPSARGAQSPSAQALSKGRSNIRLLASARGFFPKTTSEPLLK